MNLLKTTMAAVTLCAAAATAHAVPVQYSITGIFSEETANEPIEPGDYLFNTSSTFTGGFVYDSAATGTINGDDNLIKAFYPTAVSLFVGSTDGHLFGSANNATVLRKTCMGSDCPAPVTLSLSSTPSDIRLLGFSIGDFTLKSWELLLYSNLTEATLPGTLGWDDTATLTLVFANSRDDQRSVVFNISDVSPVAPVPLPASGLLFSGALAGLAVKTMRRRKNHVSA